MPIDTTEITGAEAEKILAQHEGHFVDFKARQIRPGNLTKHISAFANADGGELYIGVFERTTQPVSFDWNGFFSIEDANGHLQVFEHLFPLGADFQYEFLWCRSKPGYLLRVEIRKTRHIVKTQDGTFYVRRGAQSLPVDTEEKRANLARSKGLTSFETERLSAPLDLVTNSEAIISFMLNIVPHSEPEAWLRKQLLIVGDMPTVAAALLFCDEPQIMLPKRSAIKIYRYKTRGEGSRDTLADDPITIEGCVYSQIIEAVDKTVSIVESIPRLGDGGLESIRYPRVAIHEIVTNAVLHRDYFDADDVHIRIFDNRIEVESPGRLPAHITPSNILEERFARNPSIVRLINKFPNPPNKDVGEGLRTAIEAMKKLRLKPPELEEKANSVIVYIRHEPLASPEELILQYLREHGTINNSIGRSLCHVGSENEMKRIFQRLMKGRQIERIPNRKGPLSAYRLVGSDAIGPGSAPELPFGE